MPASLLRCTMTRHINRDSDNKVSRDDITDSKVAAPVSCVGDALFDAIWSGAVHRCRDNAIVPFRIPKVYTCHNRGEKGINTVLRRAMLRTQNPRMRFRRDLRAHIPIRLCISRSSRFSLRARGIYICQNGVGRPRDISRKGERMPPLYGGVRCMDCRRTVIYEANTPEYFSHCPRWRDKSSRRQ